MIELIKGDITKIKADAIVNAANPTCLGGGGVDGAIHRAGGSEILEECKKIIKQIGILQSGKSVITTAGNLPAKYVIHTVGPVWKDGNFDEEITLKSAYLSSLKLADDYKLKSIVFPNISTGIYGFPKQKAAEIAIKTVKDFIEKTSIEKVIFVCFDYENYNIYNEILKQ